TWSSPPPTPLSRSSSGAGEGLSGSSTKVGMAFCIAGDQTSASTLRPSTGWTRSTCGAAVSAGGGAVGRGEVVKPMAVDASTPAADWPRATGVPGVATTTAATMAMMAATAVAAVAGVAGVESAAARRVFTLATLVDRRTSARACDRSVVDSRDGTEDRVLWNSTAIRDIPPQSWTRPLGRYVTERGGSGGVRQVRPRRPRVTGPAMPTGDTRSVVSTSRVRRMSPDAPHALFLRHPVKPGKRDELVEVWRRHMPEAIEANDGHEAYVYCASHADRDVLVVYQ